MVGEIAIRNSKVDSNICISSPPCYLDGDQRSPTFFPYLAVDIQLLLWYV